jgi:hypothetical protein
MKIMKTLFALLAVIGSSNLSAQDGAAVAAAQDAQRQQPTVCVPYSVQAPCAPCENGSGNMMCKTTTATCQNGVAVPVTTPAFNTLTCNAAMADTSVATCAQQPEGCASTSPRSGACPAGKYWVNPPDQPSPFYSSLIAVCVPSCPVGTQLSYTTSPPSCIGIVCPGNQQLFGNVCGCPASLPLQVGNMCTAVPSPTPDCNIASVPGASVSCAVAGFAGYSGIAYETNFTAHSGGSVCNSVFAGFSQGSCLPPALPPCDTGVANGNPTTCNAAGYTGYTGTAYQTVFTTYSGGGACAQMPTGGYSVGSCAPPAAVTCSGLPPAATIVSCSDQTGGLWAGTPYSSTPYFCSGTSWLPGATVVINNCTCANGNPAGTANCFECPAGTSGWYPGCACINGATNPGACTTCPAGWSMIGGICKSNAEPPPAGPPCVEGDMMLPGWMETGDPVMTVPAPNPAVCSGLLMGGGTPPAGDWWTTPGSVSTVWTCTANVKRKMILAMDAVCGSGWTTNALASRAMSSAATFKAVVNAYESANPSVPKAPDSTFEWWNFPVYFP